MKRHILLLAAILPGSCNRHAVQDGTYTSNAIRNCTAKAIKQAGGNISEWYRKVRKSGFSIEEKGLPASL